MLKRIIKAVSVTVTIVCLVVCLVPVQAFAVDPISTTMVANAFAQAVAAYGSSQGVAMTFEVGNTDGIGSGVHNLWQQFRESQNSADDYDSLASVYVNSSPYTPVDVNIAGQTIKALGIDIDSALKPVLDDFYNWLLTGPAEMVKVDNEYFEFSSTNTGIGGSSVVVQRFSTPGFYNQPFSAGDVFPVIAAGSNAYAYNITLTSIMPRVFLFRRDNSNVAVCDYQGATYSMRSQRINSSSYNDRTYQLTDSFSYNGKIYYFSAISNNWAGVNAASGPDAIPQYSSSLTVDEMKTQVIIDVYGLVNPSTVGVRGYDDVGIADIPDTADPNYDALHPTIPMDIPWDNTAYGDGTGVLTDSQVQDIISDLLRSIIKDGYAELADEGLLNPDPEVPEGPGEVYVPFLPITLPSFNFNLSGIWHYVREWVSSLSSWFATMFTIWSCLPYAMVVPVYATAVVVIVLGVYKRFFM